MSTTTISDDDLLKALKKALPNEPVTLEQLQIKRKKQKINTALVVGSAIAISLIISGISAALVGAIRITGVAPINPVDVARANFWQERDRYVEYISRYDRNPQIIGKEADPGAWQQLLALDAREKQIAVSSQLVDPNHPSFRKHASVAYALAEVNWNEVLTLSRLGQKGVLEYINAEGVRVRIPISAPGLGAIAINQLAALDLAQNLEQMPQYDQAKTVSRVGELQNTLRLSRATYIAIQGFSDASEDLKQIVAFKKLTSPVQQEPPSLLPPAVVPKPKANPVPAKKSAPLKAKPKSNQV